jgi:hypothetical protein
MRPVTRGGDQTCARAEKRVVDCLAAPVVLAIGRRMNSTGFWVPRLELCSRSRSLKGLLLAIRPNRGLRPVAFCQWLASPARTVYTRSRSSSDSRRGLAHCAAWPRRSEREAGSQNL